MPFLLSDYAYAHRGLWNAEQPENSPAAFRAAADLGLGAECDVRLTRDGEVVVHHDASLARLFDAPSEIRDLTLEDLQAHRFPNSDETIPTLGDIVDIMGDLPLLIELKVDEKTDKRALASAVYETFRKRYSKVGIMSFDSDILKHFMDPGRDFKLGYLTPPLTLQTEEGVEQTKQALRDLTADFYAPHVIDCGHARAHICNQDQALLSWTVSEPEHLQFLKMANAIPIFEKLDPGLVTAATSTT